MNEPELVSVSRIRQIISLIDLTNLSNNCDHAAIETLCHQANTQVGCVAAVCLWPSFVLEAKNILGNTSPIRIATVVNFPAGNEPQNKTCAIIEKALKDGADEIDYVLPYTELINGNANLVASDIGEIRQIIPASKTLKVILETGVLENKALIRTAAIMAIEQGAEFIKTSTGKVPVNATTEAATIMLDAIACSRTDVGFKAAGGIKTVEDANGYLSLAEGRLGQAWPDAAHFRFGASGLLQDALTRLNLSPTTDNKDNY